MGSTLVHTYAVAWRISLEEYGGYMFKLQIYVQRSPPFVDKSIIRYAQCTRMPLSYAVKLKHNATVPVLLNEDLFPYPPSILLVRPRLGERWYR